jgi:GntR family transcriptional regulator
VQQPRRVREALPSIIAGQAEARIRSGKWPAGSRLPPERELCQLFDVSRSTLRLALDELEEAGLITRHQGRGTFVSRPRIETDASSYFTIGASLRAQGSAAVTKVLGIEIAEAGRSVATDLGLLPGDQVIHLERLRMVDAIPLLLESSWLPLALFPDLADQDLVGRSLYDILREEYSCDVVAATETLEPVILTPRESGLLGVGRHAPALLIRRLGTDAAGHVVELSQALLRGDRSRLLLNRQVAQGEATEPWPASPFTIDAASPPMSDRTAR